MFVFFVVSVVYSFILVQKAYLKNKWLVDREEPRRWQFTAGFVHLEVFDFARLGGWQR
jgi:hypothetical protein